MWTTRNTASGVLFVLLLSVIACSGDFCKETTAAVVGKTVEGSKSVTKGIVEGVEEGRKSGESLDGAVIISSWEELEKVTTEIEVYSLAPLSPTSAHIEVAINNPTDKPLRLSGMKWQILDKEGFVHEPGPGTGAKTIAASGKDKVPVPLTIPADQVDFIRLWGHDLQISDAARKKAAVADAPGNPDAG